MCIRLKIKGESPVRVADCDIRVFKMLECLIPESCKQYCSPFAMTPVPDDGILSEPEMVSSYRMNNCNNSLDDIPVLNPLNIEMEIDLGVGFHSYTDFYKAKIHTNSYPSCIRLLEAHVPKVSRYVECAGEIMSDVLVIHMDKELIGPLREASNPVIL